MPPVRQNMQVGDRAFSMAFDLDTSKVSHANIYKAVSHSSLYEPDVAIFLMRILRPGDTFVDVGANIGYFSVLAGHMVGPEGTVLAIEPEPENVQALKQNLNLNPGPRSRVYETALAETSSQRPFFMNKDDTGGHALWDPALYEHNIKTQASPESYTITTLTLDEILAQSEAQQPKAVKIDTEGAEALVLAGGKAMLSQKPTPFLICELHDKGLQSLGSSQQELRTAMRAYGLDTFVLPRSGNLPWMVPDGTMIGSKYFLNLLFARPEELAPYFPGVDIDPAALP